MGAGLGGGVGQGRWISAEAKVAEMLAGKGGMKISRGDQGERGGCEGEFV